MGTSPDVGGRAGLGRPLEPLPHELESTAQTQVARQGLGLVQNTVDVVFTQLGGDIYKYNANAAKPKLPMNVLVAATHPERPQTDEKAKTQFRELFKEIPLKLQLNMAKEMKKPPHERDPKYVVFEQILRFAAKALVWLKEVSEITPEGLEESISKSAAFPYFSLRGWINQAVATLNSSLALRKQGLLEAVVYNDNKALLKPLIEKGKEVIDSKSEEKMQMALRELLTEALNSKKRIEKDQFPNALGITGIFLSSLVSLLHAMTYQDKAPAVYPFSFGSETIKLGKGYQLFLNEISENIPDVTDSQKHYLEAIFTVWIMLYTTLVTEASGIAKTTTIELDKQPKRVQSFAFMLASGLLSSSRFIQMIAKEALVTLEIDSALHEVLIATVATLAMSVPIVAGAKGEKSASIIEGVEKTLREEFQTIKAFLAKSEKNALSTHLASGLRQAAIALKKHETSGYLEAVQGAMKPLHQKLSSMQDESERITIFALVLLNNIYQITEQEKFTSAVIQAA